MATDFASMIGKERERLATIRQEALARRKAVDDEIAAIDREMKAITAYETAKSGKQPTNGTRSPRDGSRRQAVLDIINKTPDGIGPIAIIEQMGLRGDKKGETAVRAMLFQLKKGKVIGTAKKGMYTPL